ncbi:hypothetical protein TNCV_705141 [Trichonephila clavipes]|nr:hypothetical protein TNCV_705141 [Trichonephila clavipes]
MTDISWSVHFRIKQKTNGNAPQSLPIDNFYGNCPVPTTSGGFTRGRIIGKLEEGRSVTSGAAEIGIAHSIVSRLLNNFKLQNTIRGSVVVIHEEPHPQMTGHCLTGQKKQAVDSWRNRRHTTQATGRPISRFTVARRLPGGGLFARRCTVCTFNACPRRSFSVVPGTPKLERQ